MFVLTLKALLVALCGFLAAYLPKAGLTGPAFWQAQSEGESGETPGKAEKPTGKVPMTPEREKKIKNFTGTSGLGRDMYRFVFVNELNAEVTVLLAYSGGTRRTVLKPGEIKRQDYPMDSYEMSYKVSGYQQTVRVGQTGARQSGNSDWLPYSNRFDFDTYPED